jgi:excisionase family DNA binding protein
MPATAPPLLTVPEVAAALGLSRARAYALIAEGRIPAVHISSRSIRVPRAAFDAWLREKAETALASLVADELDTPERRSAPRAMRSASETMAAGLGDDRVPAG